MRDWLKSLDEIDRDCVHQYESLLGRQLTGFEEYHTIDSQVDEMILEWDNREEFFKAYPDLEKYRKPSRRNKAPENSVKDAKRDRFVRIAEERTQKILNDIRSLSKCAAKESYTYEASDVARIFDAIEKELQAARDKFAGVKQFSLGADTAKSNNPEQEDITNMTADDIRPDKFHPDMDLWDDTHVYLRLEGSNTLFCRFDRAVKSEQVGPEDPDDITECYFYGLYDLNTGASSILCEFKFFETGFNLEESVEIPLTEDEQRLVFHMMNVFCIKEKGTDLLKEYSDSGKGGVKPSLSDKIQSASTRAAKSGKGPTPRRELD